MIMVIIDVKQRWQGQQLYDNDAFEYDVSACKPVC